MNFSSPITPDQIDGLVGAYLDAAGREFDASALEAAIEWKLAALERDFPRTNRRKVLRWAALAAASVVVAAVVGERVLLSPSPANAYSLVSSANSALSRARDRCYHVDALKVPPTWARGIPFLQSAEKTTVCTRGDRFRVITVRKGQELLWGQDEQHRVWGVVSPRVGLLYDRDELPPAFVEALSYLNLDVRSLTQEILSDYDLKLDPDSGPGLLVIQATRKRKQKTWHHFTSVRLEIEESTKIIRRMEVTRTVRNAEIARFAFTLVSEESVPDQQYRIDGNLERGAEVFDRNRSSERLDLLRGLSVR